MELDLKIESKKRQTLVKIRNFSNKNRESSAKKG